MKNSNIKKQLMIIVGSVLFFTSFILVIFYILPKKEKNIPQIITKNNKENIPFEIKEKPQGGEIETVLDNLAFNFTFSKEIDRNSVFIQITPDTEFEISFSNNNKTLTIFPKNKWIYEIEYQIKINLKSKEKDELKEPILYTFKIKKTKDSPMDESQIVY